MHKNMKVILSTFMPNVEVIYIK